MYLVTRSLNPKGIGQTRWAMRWKPALNAFAITSSTACQRPRTDNKEDATHTVGRTDPGPSLDLAPTYWEPCKGFARGREREDKDCVPAGGVTPLRVMLCVMHYAVRAWVVSITPVLLGRGVRAVGSDGVSMAMEVSER